MGNENSVLGHPATFSPKMPMKKKIQVVLSDDDPVFRAGIKSTLVTVEGLVCNYGKTLLVAAIWLVSACSPRPVIQVDPSPLSPTSTLEIDPPTAGEPTGVASTKTAPVEPDHDCSFDHPAFLFIYQGSIQKQSNCEQYQVTSVIGSPEGVMDAFFVYDQILVLSSFGVRSVDLKLDSIQTLQKTESPYLFGEIRRIDQAGDVVVSAFFDDPVSPTSFGTVMGIYQGGKQELKLFPVFHQSLWGIGYHPDKGHLMALPKGMDADLVDLAAIDLTTGIVEERFSIRGEINVTMSPDGRYIATLDYEIPESTGQLKRELRIYENGISSLDLVVSLELPDAPSHANPGDLTWSPDSSSLYLLLRPGSPEETPPESAKLIRFDISKQEFHVVADDIGGGHWYHIEDISKDGEWLLLRNETTDSAIMAHLPAGELNYFWFYFDAIFAGWD